MGVGCTEVAGGCRGRGRASAAAINPLAGRHRAEPTVGNGRRVRYRIENELDVYQWPHIVGPGRSLGDPAPLWQRAEGDVEAEELAVPIVPDEIRCLARKHEMPAICGKAR